MCHLNTWYLYHLCVYVIEMCVVRYISIIDLFHNITSQDYFKIFRPTNILVPPHQTLA